jgi:hypothetical protein
MNRVILILGALAVVLIAIAIVTSKKARVQNNPGEIYSVQDRNGHKVVKILAVDSRAVHVRLYKNYFSHRPQSVDVNTLTLGSVYDADGFGVGHLPLTATTFSSWLPMLIFAHNRHSGGIGRVRGMEEIERRGVRREKLTLPIPFGQTPTVEFHMDDYR